MKITTDALSFFAHHHNYLAVDLETYQAIDNMDTLLLKHARPADIALLIKARFKFHQDRYLFPTLRCFEQCFHHWCILSNAVNRLLDRQYIGVTRRGTQKIDDWNEGIIGLM